MKFAAGVVTGVVLTVVVAVYVAHQLDQADRA